MSKGLGIALAALSGILVSASFPIYLYGWRSPELGWVMWIALVPLFISIRDLTPRKSFLLTFIAAIIWYASSVFWAVHAMYVFGNMPLHTSVPLTILMVLFLAAYISLAPTLAAFIKVRWRGEAIVWMPVLWVAVEFCKNYFPCGGFPWSNISMSQSKMIPLIQIVDIVGVYGLAFLIVWVNVFISECVLRLGGCEVRGFFSKAVVTAAIVAVSAGYGIWRIHDVEGIMAESPGLEIAMIQGNISQDQKWDSDKAEENLNAYRKAISGLEKTTVDLIVWPESAFPWYIEERMTAIRPRALGLGEDMIGPYPYTLVGALTETKKEEYYNSAVLFNAQGDIIDRYHKVHLAPFGEYVPYKKLLFFAEKLTEPSGNFLAGSSAKVLSMGEYKFGPLICYEDIFPEISGRLAAMGAEFLVNLTNNAWFGSTSAPYQQLAQATFRAVETRRYLARCTNTGISAVIDPIGRVLVESQMFEPATIVAGVGRMKALSLYTRLGDWFAMGCAAYALIGLGFALWRKIRKFSLP